MSLFLFEALCITSHSHGDKVLPTFSKYLRTATVRFAFVVCIGTGAVSSGCIVT